MRATDHRGRWLRYRQELPFDPDQQSEDERKYHAGCRFFPYKSGISMTEFLTVMQGKKRLLMIDNYNAFAGREAAELIASDEVDQYLNFAHYASVASY